MDTVTIAHAKEHLEKLIERATQGEDVRIADADGREVRLQSLSRQIGEGATPIADPVEPSKPLPLDRVPGRFKGKYQVPARLMEPMSEHELRDWYGDDP